jgi:hypothetical protein
MNSLIVMPAKVARVLICRCCSASISIVSLFIPQKIVKITKVVNRWGDGTVNGLRRHIYEVLMPTGTSALRMRRVLNLV